MSPEPQAESDRWFTVRRIVERLETLDRCRRYLDAAAFNSLQSKQLRSLNVALAELDGRQPEGYIAQDIDE